MAARLNYYGNPVGEKFQKYLNSAGRRDQIHPAGETAFLCMIRASQINGCSVCTDMHTKDAVHAGETADRLNLVAAWRDAKAFTDAERAALELTEQGTRIADAAGGVSDEVWANAAKHYDDDQLAALVCADRRDQRLQPPQRHRPAAARRLPARPVVLAGRPPGFRREAPPAGRAGRAQISRSCISSTCLSVTSRRYSAWVYGARSR